jgi:YVTN family beta-propeller protein
VKFKTLAATFAVAFLVVGASPAAQASPSVVSSLEGFRGTSGVAFSSDGSRAYVVQNESGMLGGDCSLVVVDTTTLVRVGEQLSTGIACAGVTHAIAMAPDGAKAYVSLGDGKVLPFSPSSLTFGSPITVGTAGVGQIAFTPDGTRAYVAVTDNGSGTDVKVIDAASDTVLTTIFTCGGPNGLVITPDGQKAFVNCGNGNLAVINTATDTVIDSLIPTDHLQGTTIAISPDGARVYVTAFSSPSTITTVINTATLATEHVFTDEPKDLAFSRDGRLAYIFSPSSGDLIPTDATTFVAGDPIDVTSANPGDWYLVDRNPVSEEYWITGGNYVYVVSEPAQLPATGIDGWQLLSAMAMGALLLVTGNAVMAISRRRATR